MKNIDDNLTTLYRMKSWSSTKEKPREFTNYLSDFGYFEKFDNFDSFLKKNNHYLSNSDGEEISSKEVLSSKEKYENFIEKSMNMSFINNLSYENLDKEIVFGISTETPDSYENFITTNDLETKADLISFVNDVLSDHGEVTHSSGLKSQYEVVESYDDELNRKEAIQRFNQTER